MPGVGKKARSEAVYIWKHNGKKDGAIRILPGGKYADGAGLPDVTAALITVSKSFFSRRR